MDLVDITRRKPIAAGTTHEDLLVPVLRGGREVYGVPSLEESRSRARAQLASLHGGITRMVNPHEYPVGLEAGLDALRNELIVSLRVKH